jgi:hypothetical protein
MDSDLEERGYKVRYVTWRCPLGKVVVLKTSLIGPPIWALTKAGRSKRGHAACISCFMVLRGNPANPFTQGLWFR